MIWNKLSSLFKTSSEKTSNKNAKISMKATTATARQTMAVDPNRIGDLGEYKVDVQLRQFPKETKYVSDVLLANPRSRTGYAQIDNVLITPYGLFVIETKNHKGKIRGKRDDVNWRVNGRFQVYNPVRQNRTHINALKRVLAQYKEIKLISIISFTKRCELDIDWDLREVESDEIVVYDIMLTEMIERKLKRLKVGNSTPPLSETDVINIFEIISQNNITDAQIREEHVQKQEALKAERAASTKT